MTVVYLDSVFFLNAAMDYLLLLTAATLAGVPLRRKRYCLAAVLGAVYAVAVFLPGLEGLASIPAKAAAGVLVGLAAFGGELRLCRLMLLTLAVACAMAGCVLGLSLLTGIPLPMTGGIFYTDVDVPTLLTASTGVYLVIRMAFRAAAGHGVQGELLTVTLCIHGRQRQFTALWDSGNSLRDPTDGKAVLVVAPGVIEELLPDAAAELLTSENLAHPVGVLEPLLTAAPELRPRLLPYRAVGTMGGMLLGIRCDWLVVGGRRQEKALLALSPNALGDGYSGLWGGEKGGGHEILEAAAGVAGTITVPGRGTLHRRERYTSTAVGSGAGSGTGGPAGRGRSKIGID